MGGVIAWAVRVKDGCRRADRGYVVFGGRTRSRLFDMATQCFHSVILHNLLLAASVGGYLVDPNSSTSPAVSRYQKPRFLSDNRYQFYISRKATSYTPSAFPESKIMETNAGYLVLYYLGTWEKSRHLTSCISYIYHSTANGGMIASGIAAICPCIFRTGRR